MDEHSLIDEKTITYEGAQHMTSWLCAAILNHCATHDGCSEECPRLILLCQLRDTWQARAMRVLHLMK